MKKKTVFYLILLGGLLLGLVCFFAFLGQPDWRRLTVVMTALFYFLWGVVYHKQEKTLHPKVVLEYLLIAVLGASVLLSLI